MRKHVVCIYLIDRASKTGHAAQCIEETFVQASSLDTARTKARELVESKSYKVRTVSFGTNGKILVYTEGKVPYRRKRTIAASTLGVSPD